MRGERHWCFGFPASLPGFVRNSSALRHVVATVPPKPERLPAWVFVVLSSEEVPETCKRPIELIERHSLKIRLQREMHDPPTMLIPADCFARSLLSFERLIIQEYPLDDIRCDDCGTSKIVYDFDPTSYWTSPTVGKSQGASPGNTALSFSRQ